MTSTESIRAFTRQVASEFLGDTNVLEVQVEAALDESGGAALQILLVIPQFDPGLASKRAEIVLKVLEFLGDRDDPRFPYLHFATQAEMAAEEVASDD